MEKSVHETFKETLTGLGMVKGLPLDATELNSKAGLTRKAHLRDALVMELFFFREL